MTDPVAPLTAEEAQLPEQVGDVMERGIVPCRQCRKPHDRRITEDRDPYGGYVRQTSWAAEDGHAYQKMTADDVMRYLDAARSVPDNADHDANADHDLADCWSVPDNVALRAITQDYRNEATVIHHTREGGFHEGPDWRACVSVQCVRMRAAIEKAEAALAAAPASPTGLDVTDLRARVATNLRVAESRIERGIGREFDEGKRAAFRVVLSMIDHPRPEPTFVCAKPALASPEEASRG